MPAHEYICRDCDAPFIPPETAEFYRHGMRILREAQIPFVVAGARALCAYTGIDRHTKDFDVALRPADVARALAAARHAGYRAELTFPHWLAKIHHGDDFIDLIFRAGNGLCEVDDAWLAHAREHVILGVRAPVCAPEEMILPKAYVMERERYDGADIAHLLCRCAEQIDFHRLLRLFGEHWRLLLSQLVLFGFIYPGERDRIPAWVLQHLTARLQNDASATESKLCRGTLLSRTQYLPDLDCWGYADARLRPAGPMTAEEIAAWTIASG